MTGKIKFYYAKKGYGFIRGDDGTDIFFHITDVTGFNGVEHLERGQRVSYQLGKCAKGEKAVDVTLA